MASAWLTDLILLYPRADELVIQIVCVYPCTSNLIWADLVGMNKELGAHLQIEICNDGKPYFQ